MVRALLLSALALTLGLRAVAAPWSESPVSSGGESDSRPESAWSQTSLVLPRMVTSVTELDGLFERFMPGRRHPLCWTQEWPLGLRPESAFSLFPFLMRRGSAGPVSYPVPFAATLREGFGYRLYQQIYEDGPCLGMSTLEADFKGRCSLPEPAGEPQALVLLQSLPEIVQNFGTLAYEHQHLPEQGVLSSYPGLLYEIEPRLLGFHSNSDARGFRSPLSSLDKYLYSTTLGRYIDASDRFADLRDLTDPQEGAYDLYFAGNTSLIFLGHLDAEGRSPAARLLKVGFTPDHKPVLSVRNGLLSASDFINYGFYTEAELLVLQDLDYKLNPRDFYGYSIYTSGTPEQLQPHLLATGYAAWDDAQSNYNYKQYSRVPLGVGAHIYGDYNQVEQVSDIASAGAGAIGVRIDGSGNYYQLNKKYAIYEQGQHASGITVAYGHDNRLDIRGTVAADSTSGVGILCSYGSNLHSDLLEYQGSYHRVRSHDYLRGVLNREEAQRQPLPADLQGPLLKRLTVSGAVRGGSAAIRIARNAHVEEIYFEDRAQVIGDLISEWEPYESDGEFYIRASDHALLPAQLQLEYRPDYARESNFNLLSDKLKTRVVFGADNYFEEGRLDAGTVGLKPDDDAFIEFSGSLDGSALNVYSVGGQTNLRGSFKVNRLEIGSSVLHLEHLGGKASSTNELVLRAGGVLDLVNAVPNTVIVEDRALLDSRAVIHVDINERGAMIDRLWFNGGVMAADNKINLEPGMNFEILKRFTSDPKALYTFIRHFMVQSNHTLKRYGLQVRFPRHIWLDSGDLGREIRCGIHDCHVGRYVAASEISTPKLPLWRYLVSGAGLILLLLTTWFFMRRRS